MKESMAIAMAFVGLLVGAGFATGKEMMQYFVSFGTGTGIWALVLTGIVLIVVSAVILQIGSFFLADEHGAVFKNVAHPRVSWILDVAVSITMATMGMMMLAGAGSTFEQSFGVPSWLGSLIMAVIVYFVCFLNPVRVSSVIGAVTPLMIVAIVVLFIYTIVNIPEGFSVEAANEIALNEPTPVKPWWWSAMNYAGMSLICAVGMSLVIGGSYTKLKAVAVGGMLGGLILTIILVLETIVLFFNVDTAAGKDIPMAAIVTNIHPVAGYGLSLLILVMIFNTALGDVYAFSRRIQVATPTPQWVNLLVILGISWAISLIGFGPLIQIIFPILGYIGMVIGVIFVIWRIRWSHLITGEKQRRHRIRQLTRAYINPKTYDDHSLELNHELDRSKADNEKLLATVADEERTEIEDEDDSAEQQDSKA
ncbi:MULTISPECIES: hypothetical protein [unclassified Corynebacterium]|uniref:YkvI family membrane protein n=1 Tax=unclassified Corynebacterium TaxID=2624378 RepID=UPI001C496DAC|nr:MULTISPECIES: hypothetical protein [unclassified Corynebacterium]MBV7282850.1 hypothetical protein [Corynebacterium sp. TAE3-ERU30]MBV7302762.1 hypothetical protein [Corynebacterium sp. TAE3-ERU2]